MADESSYFAPSLFVNHGGGPNPVLGVKSNLEFAKSLREVKNYVDFSRLKGILLVTAHWEADIVSISSGEKHELLFDYYNFPPESYEYKYGGRGDPILARKVYDALSKEGIPSRLDDKRGWDHGVFIPMMLIRPEADIPIVQVSVLKNHDAKQHYEIGKVLYQFRKDGIAVLGSGLSYHNMKSMKAMRGVEIKDGELDIQNEEFDSFLNKVCTSDEQTREGLLSWRKVPGALEAHPEGEADHFMPLVVAAGAAGPSKGRRVHESAFYNRFRMSGFVWE
ncbi:hypothetical protein ABMA28_012896 [Loxostege sticticalis]|uniref:Extradiol ring-cleavage dioxygenase class III enzyme subunit B domain-containing protein n=1 Tax=Loxostege sticticalis TaxID=481309 RepID=A0ABD0S361_LOXSC